MNVDDELAPNSSRRQTRKQQDVKVIRLKGQPRRYISQHFALCKATKRDLPTKDSDHGDLKTAPNASIDIDDTGKFDSEASSAPPLITPRVFFGLNIDELSTDSELSDLPQDIGPDPFFSDEDALPPSVSRAIEAKGRRKRSHPKQSAAEKSTKITSVKRSPAISPYFPFVKHAHRPQFLATLPFPPLSHDHFGLMQEKLAHDPYRLLLATIFLNKTPGMRAMPIFYNLMKQYPSPRALAEADVANVTAIIHELGFQNQRARKCVELAKIWVKSPPVMGKRYRKLHYPRKGDGKDVKEDEVIEDLDSRVAWEISHLPGLGPYSHDSWRMFCRDKLRNRAEDWLGTGATVVHFEPEWKRVLPADKELRAWMTWMWLKEGWIWNKETGEKTKADDNLMRLANGGGTVQESAERDHLIIRGISDPTASSELKIEAPAGSFVA